MRTLLLISLLLPAAAAPAQQAAPCLAKEFQVELYRAACEQGQAVARREALRFVKDVVKAKRKGGERDYLLRCDTCHESLAPDYRRRADAVERHRALSAQIGR